MIAIHPEVETALSEGRPVVALETAVVTHGLPRTPSSKAPRLVEETSKDAESARNACWADGRPPAEWRGDRPLNLEVARFIEATVRNQGGTPATVAVIEGTLHVGLDEAQLERLADRDDVAKCSTRELGRVMARKESGGTTVAGTLGACQAANRELAAAGLPAIEVFATGGIGGVHRNWNQHGDISADIRALSETSMAVISAGAKVILDLPATREALDTGMVPVFGWQTGRFPMFTAPGIEDEHPLPRFDDIEDMAASCRMHWDVLHRGEAVLVANEIPNGLGLDPERLEMLVKRAISEAEAEGISGAALTPFLLSRLAESTEGDALDANITLLCSNASVGARLAAALARQRGQTTT